MLRRFAVALRSVLNQSRLVDDSIFRPVINESYFKAHRDLKEAITELQSGMGDSKLTSPPRTLLDRLEDNDFKDIPTVELEQAAFAYFHGTNGCELNKKRAILIWNEAAARGSIPSAYSLAACKREGVEMKIDPQGAFQSLKFLAEEHDFNFAHYALGIMYYNAEGCEKNLEKSFAHFMKASKGGVTTALYNVANMYHKGEGTEKDEGKALQYYDIASELGDYAAKFMLATILSSRDDASAANVEKAIKLYTELANLGHPMAAFNLGTFYFSGKGVQQDVQSAIKLFEQAAALGVEEALVNLGNIYRTGFGVPVDLEKAAGFFRAGAEKNNEICKGLLQEVERENLSALHIGEKGERTLPL